MYKGATLLVIGITTLIVLFNLPSKHDRLLSKPAKENAANKALVQELAKFLEHDKVAQSSFSFTADSNILPSTKWREWQGSQIIDDYEKNYAHIIREDTPEASALKRILSMQHNMTYTSADEIKFYNLARKTLSDRPEEAWRIIKNTLEQTEPNEQYDRTFMLTLAESLCNNEAAKEDLKAIVERELRTIDPDERTEAINQLQLYARLEPSYEKRAVLINELKQNPKMGTVIDQIPQL